MEEDIGQEQSVQLNQTVGAQNQPVKPWLKIVGLAVLGLFLAGGLVFAGYWYGKNSPLRQGFAGQAKLTPAQVPVATSAPTFSPENAPLSDETADWKSYTSSYGYTIRYPPTWEVKTSNWSEGNQRYGLQKDDEVIVRYLEPDQAPHGGFPYGITLNLKLPKDNPNKLGARQWAEKTLSGDEISIILENTVIAGVPSIKAVSIFNGTNFSFFIPYKLKVYSIYTNIFVETDAQSDNYAKIIDQILSTFKFLD